MQIARGSTFDFTISLPEEYDISDAKAIWITFVQYDKEVFTKTAPNDLDVEENHIYCALDQEDTLKFIAGSAKLQVRILTSSDEAIVQEPPTKIIILDILKDGVIS